MVLGSATPSLFVVAGAIIVIAVDFRVIRWF